MMPNGLTVFIRLGFTLSFCLFLSCEDNKASALQDLRLMRDAYLNSDQYLQDQLDQDQLDSTVDMGEIYDIEMPNRSHPLPPDGYPLFRLPIHDENVEKIDHRVVFGVDHDPQTGNRILCEDYAGRIFPYCYDGHMGSDFILLGGFETMDNDSAQVVAALGGIVIETQDGEYDRCHGDPVTFDVSCDGYPMRPNYVAIEHDGGWRTDYYHLKRGSVQVRVGDRVTCGDILGLVGSSGYSSAPHLHFEVSDQWGLIWDPFAGPSSQIFSLWVSQPPLELSESLPSTSCSSP
jgi:murein DD-endopeptidase MepM/ murein hydrolase activator NlpD